MTDPYPAVGSNYRPNFEPTTTNRSITLTKEEVKYLQDVFTEAYKRSDPSVPTPVTTLYEKVSRL
tara:strand:+ start:285 stop:479 length:195 start_codon:yes stop_codon:yes gene_type:complete